MLISLYCTATVRRIFKLNYLYFKIQTDLKRLKKKLPKAMKAVKLDDRLILVGKSRCTFDGEMKPHPHPQT